MFSHVPGRGTINPDEVTRAVKSNHNCRFLLVDVCKANRDQGCSRLETGFGGQCGHMQVVCSSGSL